MNLANTLKELAGTISAAPDHYAIIPVPGLSALSDNFVLPASVNTEHLRHAIVSWLPIALAATVDPKNENPVHTDLSPFAIRAEVFFHGPHSDGKAAVIFETGQQVAVKYNSDGNGGIRATARPDDFWSI
jgi:hypothetical protein